MSNVYNGFLDEQKRIIKEREKIREKTAGLAFNRFRGDSITRIVSHFLVKYLPSNVKIVRQAWIENCPTEFDLLIVDKNAKPIGFTSSYPKEKVHILIEVKGSGFFYKKDEIYSKVKKQFDKWRNNTFKPILYLSLWERKRNFDSTVRAIGKDESFILQINKEIRYGEWERFVKAVKSYL